MKAVLVLDEMPGKCEDCPVGNFDRPRCYCFCMGKQAATNRIIGEGTGEDWRPNDCPFREMPAHFDVEFNPQDKGLDRISYMTGWNDCLDKMGGKDDKTCVD